MIVVCGVQLLESISRTSPPGKVEKFHTPIADKTYIPNSATLHSEIGGLVGNQAKDPWFESEHSKKIVHLRNFW